MELEFWNKSSLLHTALLSARTERREPAASRTHLRKKNGRGRKQSNRVLMLGRLRELALYRAEVLHHHGFEVSAPATEAEAVSAIEQGNFDIAILSYTLPDSAVHQFAELIRQRCPDAPILAIAQTTHYDRRIAPDSVVLGDKGPSELVAALRRLLQNH